MSSTASPAATTVAFQLIASVEDYEDDIVELVNGRVDEVSAQRLSRRLADIQRLGAALPDMAVPTVALRMAHSALVQALRHARHHDGPLDGDEVARKWKEHGACLAAIRQQCMRHLSRSRHR